MIIGDDWFTKTMLINTLSRNQNVRSLMGTTGTSNLKTFVNLFSDILMQMESELSEQPGLNTVSPSFKETINPTIKDAVINTTSDEPLGFQLRNVEQINQQLDGRLSGMGQSFLRAGKQYNLDPALLAAIAQHESGNGKSHAANLKNNIAGMMGKSGLKSYDSIENSIMDMARNLSKNYLGQGLTTIAQIGAKYAPIGAANDPTGLNNHWVTGVTKYFNQLKV